jgi:hypothetical protein
LLKGESDEKRSDAQANGTVTPGHLISRDSINTSRGADIYEATVHSTDDAKTAPLVALEYAKTGRGISDDYSDGDNLEYYVANPGDRFYAFVSNPADISTSANANVSVGDTLGSDGNGALRAGVTAGNEMFEALEAVDNSGGSGQARIEVEAI